MQTPILGQAYELRSPNAADNRMINIYPEVIPVEGKTSGWLQRAPGLRKLLTIAAGPIRGLWQKGAYMYAVVGQQFYQIDANWTATLKGTLAAGDTVNPASMADNGTQIMIATNPNGYIYNTNTDVFGKITDPDFPGAVQVAYLDGYFVFNEPNSQKVWVTSLLDGTQVDPLEFASAEGSPDLLVGLIVSNREAWLLGSNSIEIWYDAGTLDFPLARIQGAANELGCAATYSIAKMDNSVFWLGQDARGRGIVYRSSGYTAVRISNHAVEWQIQQYDDLDKTIAFTYQQDGHLFYVLNFPTAGKTWVYDVTTQSWHERAGWNNGAFTRYRANCQTYFNNEIVVGDFENGNIYALDMEYYTYDTAPQKWLRTWRALPANANNMKRTAHHSLQLDCETGVGINIGQGSDPEVMLRWSDDGGHTWSNEHWTKMGKIGQYGYRAFWRRLGMTMKLRDRVYEVSGTDPIKLAIVGAELIVSATDA